MGSSPAARAAAEDTAHQSAPQAGQPLRQKVLDALLAALCTTDFDTTGGSAASAAAVVDAAVAEGADLAAAIPSTFHAAVPPVLLACRLDNVIALRALVGGGRRKGLVNTYHRTEIVYRRMPVWQTPLHYAVEHNSARAVAFLMRQGAQAAWTDKIVRAQANQLLPSHATCLLRPLTALFVSGGFNPQPICMQLRRRYTLSLSLAGC